MNLAIGLFVLFVLLSSIAAMYADIVDHCRQLAHEARLDELWGEDE